MIDESTVTLVKLCDIMSNETFGCIESIFFPLISNLMLNSIQQMALQPSRFSTSSIFTQFLNLFE